MPLIGCGYCGLVVRLPEGVAVRRCVCPRCQGRLESFIERIRHNGWSGVFSFAALVFYPAALFLPMLRVEQLGHAHESNLIEGVTSLLTHGELVVGIVVLACSVLLPLSKLGVMAVLALSRLRRGMSAPMRVRLFQFVELTGRWSFIDLLLVALLVSILKIGDMVEVAAGPGVLAFALCVVFSLLSALFFQDKTLWRDETG